MRWIDDDLEGRLLAAVLLNKAAWYKVSDTFNPDRFAIEEFRSLAKLIQKIADEGKLPTVTQVHLAARKHGLDVDMLPLDSPVILSEVSGIYQVLGDMSRKRLAREKLLEAVHAIENSDRSADEVIAIAQDALLGAFQQEKQAIQTWEDTLQEVYEAQMLAQEGKLDEGIPLGLPVLEAALGALVRGHQYILAARPSMGKSALAMNIVKAVIKGGRRAILFTPEQQNKEFAARSLAAELDIPLSMFGVKMDTTYLDKFNTGLSKVHSWPLSMMDKPRPTVNEIKAICRTHKAQFPDLDLMVVDYLGEMDIKGGGSYQLALGEAVSELRGLAKELGIAQVIVSQLNRGVEQRDDKRPMMSDLRESGRIEEVADTIMFLYRHGYYNQEFMGNEYGDKITEIHIAKSRQKGSAGKRLLALFDYHYMRFEPLEERWRKLYQEAMGANGKPRVAGSQRAYAG